MKVSEEEVKAAIKRVQYHRFEGTTVTVCCLTLDNDFTATGESACVDPIEYSQEMGEGIAYKAAFGKAWAYLGFRLAEKLATQKEG
jgi:hypothetical protein